MSKAAELIEYLNGDLTYEEKNLLTSYLLDALLLLPLSDILFTDKNSGELKVKGSPIDMTMARNLRESARAALANKALTLIREQVSYEAVNAAVRVVETPRDLLFYRAALWWGAEVEKKLKVLAQQTQQPEL